MPRDSAGLVGPYLSSTEHPLSLVLGLGLSMASSPPRSEKEPGVTFKQKDNYTFEELLECGHGRLFGEGNAQLPLPPFLRVSDML